MKKATLATASVVSAVFASLCCIGPLVAVGLGVGTFGAAALFESLRPYLLAGTGVLLAGAFYLTYRSQPDESCEGEACTIAPDRKSQKAVLWAVTAAVVTLAGFPYYSNMLWDGGTTVSASTTESSIATTVFDVEGMTCAGCAVTLQNALKNAPGVRSVEVDLEQKIARVSYDPARAETETLLTVINESGFTGRPRGHTSASRERIGTAGASTSELFSLELQYRPEAEPVTSAEGRGGPRLGGGDGWVEGPGIRGSVRWDIYENQGSTTCEFNLTGFLDTEEGTVTFDARGLGVKPDPTNTNRWSMVSVAHFTTSTEAHADLAKTVAALVGEFDMATGLHRYRALTSGSGHVAAVNGPSPEQVDHCRR